jgi:hypothetical protein
MKKVIRLTESDLMRIVKRVITEQKISDSDKKMFTNHIVSNGDKCKDYYINHFSKPETINKFTNKNNILKIKEFIPVIKYKPFFEKSGKNGFVNQNNLNIINLNLNNLFTKSGGVLSPKGTLLYDTILHEMGHLIDFKLQSLGEQTIASSSAYYKPTDNKDAYVQSDVETYARIQRLREVLGLNPNAGGVDIKNKIVEFIKSNKIQFPNIRIMGNDKNPGVLLFTEKNRTKGVLTELWRFYSSLKINNTYVPDISALFAKYSKINNNSVVILDLNLLGNVNITTKGEL